MRGITTTLDAPFTDTVRRIADALRSEGFDILSDIDVQATLKEQTGAEMAPYFILGACNPPLASRALQAELNFGLLLPCNVVVRQQTADRTVVSFVDPPGHGRSTRKRGAQAHRIGS